MIKRISVIYVILFSSISLLIYQYHTINIWQNLTQNITEDLAEDVRNATDIYDTSLKEFLNFPTNLCLWNFKYTQHQQTNLDNNKVNKPPIYVVTPTYRRPEQLADLTRLSHTLMHVNNIYWLVIEDANNKTSTVTELLSRTNLRFEHLVGPMPIRYRNRKVSKPKGVSNRNEGLKWIRQHAKDGVVYFADDDNTYDLQLFNEIRYTTKVSMFPVGLIAKLGVSTPILRDGEFLGFYDGWIGGRKFPVDMAGFAVGVKFLLERTNAIMPYKAGFEEDGFLRSLKPFEPREIEFLASNCTKILVWHTQTKRNQPSLQLDFNKYNNTNLVMLKQILV